MTTAQDQQSRAEFEAHMRKLSACARLYRHTCDGGDKYWTVTVQRNWELWQAARALPASMEPVARVCQGATANIEWRKGMTYADLPAIDGQDLYTAAQVQAMLAGEKIDMGIPFELIVHEPVLQPLRSLRSPECWCECCDTVANSGFRSRMSLCPKCGDKRCPRAYHHNSDCSAP